MNTKTGIIIQARRGSVRLPDKMIKAFDGSKGVLEIILEKIKRNYRSYPIILATTSKPEDDLPEKIATKYDILCFRGSENNVLKRFTDAATTFHLENIIRVCADNPFLDIPHIQTLISHIENPHIDYVSYQSFDGTPTIKTHWGLFAEGVKLSALQKIQQLTGNTHYLEHVTNFIYENPEHFNIQFLNLPDYFKNMENIRLTLDTEEDFLLEKEIYHNFKGQSTHELISFIRKNPQWLKKMKKQIEKNRK